MNRGKAVIDLKTRKVPAPTATGNDILLDSDGKIRMHYVVYDTHPDVGDGTRVTMAVNLTASNESGFVALGFPDKSGGMFGSQSVVCIPQYNMIVKYEFKVYADQSVLRDGYQTLMDASSKAVYGGIVLKFKKFLVKEGENDIIVNGPHNFIYAFAYAVGERHESNMVKDVINLSLVGTSKMYDINKGKWLAHVIMTGLTWGFFTLLAVGADLLLDFLPPGTTWFNIHD